ncbi:MAG: exosome complex protein Rrp42 [Desulfurococcaceae archaeon]
MSITREKDLLVPRIQAENMIKMLKKGERLDGRGLLDYRTITVVLNPIEKSEGSALVRLGNTQVIAGIKLELSKPFEDRPGEGILQVHAEFVPLASPSFEPGPPDENAIEVARVIDRSLRESKAIKLDELAIEPGKTVWAIYDDIYLIDHHGNIIDAGMLASMLALQITRMPQLIQTNEGYKIDKSVKERPIPLSTLVTTVTLGIFKDIIIVDPTLEEEVLADSLVTIAVDEHERICGIQKRGHAGLSREILERSIEIAIDKGKWLIQQLRKILNNPSEYMKPLSESYQW